MAIFTFLARMAFALTIILAPIRWRVVLVSRPNPPVYGDYTDFLLFAPDITMLATLLFWGISLIFHGRQAKFGKSHISLPLVGLMVMGWISIFNSRDALLSTCHAIRLVLLFFFYLFILNEISSFTWFVFPVSLQVLSQSIIAIGQSLLQRDLGLRALGEYALEPAWSGVSIVAANEVRFLRAYGLSDHPNILGGCLAFGMILLMSTFLPEGEVYLLSPKWLAQRSKIRTLTGMIFVLGLLALGTTFSRSAWLALLGGAGLMLTMVIAGQGWRRLKPIWILAAISLMALTPFIWINRSYFGVRFNAGGSFTKPTVENQALGERAIINSAANRIFADHALSGVGLGASPLALKERYPQFPSDYQPPHFTLLVAAMETGIFGAVFYFLLLTTPWFVFLSHKEHTQSNPLLVTTIAVLFAIAIVGLFDYYTWLLVPGRIWQWMAWGLWNMALEKRELA